MTPFLETAAIFELFAQLVDDGCQELAGFKRGQLISDPNEKPWKIQGVCMARSYPQHGTWRFGGVDSTGEIAGVALLRSIAKHLRDGGTVSPHALIVQEVAAHFPQLPPGGRIAVGLADDDTEYSGNLILIQLDDLMKTKLDDQGRLMVKTDGEYPQAFVFSFYGKPQNELIQALQAHPTQPSTRPAGP